MVKKVWKMQKLDKFFPLFISVKISCILRSGILYLIAVDEHAKKNGCSVVVPVF